MKNEDRIVELLSDLVRGQDRLTGEVSGMKSELKDMNEEIKEMNGEIKEINEELNKLNLHTSENSRAILKLAEEVRLVA